jgi:hypothetical protein
MKPTRIAAVALLVLGASMPARAEMIGTDQLLAPSPDARRERVEAFLAREDVQRELESFGVSPAEAKARAASLTEAELQEVASRVDSLPAGGGVGLLELLLIILLVLLLV